MKETFLTTKNKLCSVYLSSNQSQKSLFWCKQLDKVPKAAMYQMAKAG